MNGVPLMSESDTSQGTDASAQPSAGLKAGEILRQAREAAGLHIGALAVALKVPVKKIEALEADRFDELPDAVFVRALASSICRHLKLDAAAVLALLPAGAPVNLARTNAVSGTPFHSPQDASSQGLSAQLRQPAVLVVLALLLGALVLFLLPSSPRPDRSVSSSPASAAVPASAPVFPPGMVAEPVALPASVAAPAASDASAPTALNAVVLPTATASAASAVAAQPAASGIKGPGATVDAGQTTGLVVFKAKAASWIEVTDTKGVVVLRKTLQAGETSAASGAVPLSVVVGRADATEVTVRSKPFDLNAVAKDNVARFEVK